jgi:diguanylate cyclase (GGDEF)-like protein
MVDSPDGAGEPIHVTVSVGVAAIPDHETPDEQALLNRADQALYTAKRAGRNQIAVAGPGTAVRVEQQAT